MIEIKRFIDKQFEGYVVNEELELTKVEMYERLVDKYETLNEQGISEQDALDEVFDSIGDIRELAEAYDLVKIEEVKPQIIDRFSQKLFLIGNLLLTFLVVFFKLPVPYFMSKVIHHLFSIPNSNTFNYIKMIFRNTPLHQGQVLFIVITFWIVYLFYNKLKNYELYRAESKPSLALRLGTFFVSLLVLYVIITHVHTYQLTRIPILILRRFGLRIEPIFRESYFFLHNYLVMRGELIQHVIPVLIMFVMPPVAILYLLCRGRRLNIMNVLIIFLGLFISNFSMVIGIIYIFLGLFMLFNRKKAFYIIGIGLSLLVSIIYIIHLFITPNELATISFYLQFVYIIIAITEMIRIIKPELMFNERYSFFFITVPLALHMVLRDDHYIGLGLILFYVIAVREASNRIYKRVHTKQSLDD